MCGRRTATLLALILSGPAAAGTPPPVEAFAACAGRLTAQLEHDWLLGAPDAAATERRRDALAALLDASVPARDAARIAARRADARLAHRAVLSRASFGADPDDRAWALRRAERSVAACAALLLG